MNLDQSGGKSFFIFKSRLHLLDKPGAKKHRSKNVQEALCARNDSSVMVLDNSPVMQKNSNAGPRIALVTGCVKLGGSTTFLINLAGELVRRKIPVEILSLERENPLAADFELLNIPILCLDERRDIFEDRMKEVLRRLAEFKPTVVLANLGAISFETFRYLPSGVFRIGVGQSDDPDVYEMMRHYAPHMEALAVVSQEMKRRAATFKEFAKIPIHCLPYGVPVPDQGRKQDVQKPLQILYIGRLGREQKRVHLFPQIFEQLKKSGIPFHWTIAGDGPEKTALEEVMQNSPAQTISFPGQISYANVPKLLGTHDVFLLASDYEGLPLSLLEAMGEGLVPVVSNLKSGIPEVVNEANGILVPVDDVAGYAHGIIHLHEHRDELAAKSAAARARVKMEFSVEAMTDRWLSVFSKTFPKIDEWPARWKIRAPLAAHHPVYFSPPLRVIRRLAMKLRR
jgi:glycosyltransferase involved in cell wall biosynthesis